MSDDLPARLRAEGCACRGHLHEAIPGNVFCAVEGCPCELSREARARLGFERGRGA